MSFAELVEAVPAAEMWRYRAASSLAHWKIAAGRQYQTAFIDTPEGYRSAFLVKLPPHTAIHAHVDAGDCETHHVVLETNGGCWNYWLEDGQECRLQMELGKRYRVDRRLLHWAVNDGDADRVHLLLER